MNMRSSVEARRRANRLEAARYGELAEPALDHEALIFRACRLDPGRTGTGRRLLNELMNPLSGFVGMPGHQSFDELIEPMMLADYSVVNPASGVEIVLWTPNTSTQPHTAYPANYFTRSGQRINLQVGGSMTVPATPGTTTIRPRWGTTASGVDLGASLAIAAGTTNTYPWIIQFVATMRTLGAAGTLIGVGTYESGGVARDGAIGGTTGTIDTTTAQGIVFCVTQSVGSYAYTPKLIQQIIGG